MSYKVADMSLADWGRKEIVIAEQEMPGLMSIRKKYAATKPLQGVRVTGSLHMTIQTAVLIETLAKPGRGSALGEAATFSLHSDHAAAACDCGGRFAGVCVEGRNAGGLLGLHVPARWTQGRQGGRS